MRGKTFRGLLVLLGVGGCVLASLSPVPAYPGDLIRVSVRAKALASRSAFIYYYFTKTGDRSYFIQKYPHEVATVASSLSPGETLTLKAAFAPGRETPANSLTLTYDEASRMAQTTLADSQQGRKKKEQRPKRICIWEPLFDLTAEG